VRVRNLFVGVPDELLPDLGRVVALSSQLEFRRLKLLEASSTEAIPVTTSASWRRERVRDALLEALSHSLFEDLRTVVTVWLEDGDALLVRRDQLVHSIGGQEIRGASSRFVTEHPRMAGVTRPQITAEALDTLVWQLAEANDTGVRLYLDTTLVANHGRVAYEAHVKSREQQRKAMEAAMLEGLSGEQRTALEEALRETDGAGE